jgi:dienelactone hydrolase
MAARIRTDSVSYSARGTTLRGYLAYDEAMANARPGVLVVPEWWGLDDYIKSRARMLAELGYTALALDMYGEGKTADNPDAAGKLMNSVLEDMASGEARLKAGYEQLKAHSTTDANRIAAIGYCFGGAMVLHAARIGMPLRGVVSFHGSLGSFHKPAPGAVAARILVCHGAGDKFISDEEIASFKREMDEARASYRFISYPDALHGFTNPHADENGKKFGIPLAYSREVDEQSWREMKSFFADIFR